MKSTALSILLLFFAIAGSSQSLFKSFAHPQRESRMKTWWFFGYENTTKEGITADVKALKDAGFGGVVYYDQNHRNATEGLGSPDEGFSPEWWSNLKHAAREAHRQGLSFELNISNGYVAGGRWIDPEHAMQRVASAVMTIEGGEEKTIVLPAIKGPENYVRDIAVFAIPIKDTLRMRHFTARYNAKGKGKNGAMQGPLSELRNNAVTDARSFSGYGFKEMPDIGTLQVSDDSVNWRNVITLPNFYSSQGAYSVRTNAFPATEGRYWRVNYTGNIRLKEWSVGPEAKTDLWEEKCGLQSDFIEADKTPHYSLSEIIQPSDIVNLTSKVSDGTLNWKAPKGKWQIIRLSAVLTGAKSKHGRSNLLGYECDKLSREAAELHWNSYMQVILDSLKHDGIDWVEGVTMDSHEGGSQNWTPKFLEEFKSRRGFDLTPWLLTMAGYTIGTVEKTDSVLCDIRKTLADCIRDNYYGTFEAKAKENGLIFTAQAIGNALCIMGDAISVKSVVDKPQGEFWTYQQNGAYDIKDCSSAAHLYGKKIASAEAMTDAEYRNTPAELKRVADIAFSMGAQEFVVCATPHIPFASTKTPYIAGREYAVNRSNPQWNDMKPMWEALARSMTILQQGKAAPDVLVFLGDDIPVKTLTHRLPSGIDGLDWDVCTGDALQHRLSVSDDAELVTPDSLTYKALIMEKNVYLSPESQKVIDSFKEKGVMILTSGETVPRPLTILSDNVGDIVHTHRKINGKDVYFLANISTEKRTVKVRLQKDETAHELWHTSTGKRSSLHANTDGTIDIVLQANESAFLW